MIHMNGQDTFHLEKLFHPRRIFAPLHLIPRNKRSKVNMLDITNKHCPEGSSHQYSGLTGQYDVITLGVHSHELTMRGTKG